MPTRPPPLSGLRVLDFSRVIAGPLCTQHLADLGAEVIKVETPVTGDDVRGRYPGGEAGRSAFFKAFNRSKRSVVLDLTTPEGQDIARGLAGHCDVLLENYRPGVMARFGLDPARLRAAYPRLIYVSISAYGASGSLSDRPGFDPVLQAESGMMALTGEPDDPPMRHPLSIVDVLTANHATAAVCAALLARNTSDKGDYVDLALLDTALSYLSNAALTYLTTGEVPARSGNSHMYATPADLFHTATGPIYVVAASNRLFGRLCRDVLGAPELADDPRFATADARYRHRSALKTAIETVLVTRPAAHWLARARHLPAGKVRRLDEALESPEAAERNMVITIEDPEGLMRVLGSPFKFQDTALAAPMPPPHLGEHTRSVLSDLLGYNDDTLGRLAREGVIGLR